MQLLFELSPMTFVKGVAASRKRRRGTPFSLKQPSSYEAHVLCWVSLVLTLVATAIGIAVSVISKSSATLGFALENAVDTFSSVLVLWRFWGGGGGTPESVLEQREKRASVGIAVAFIILSCTVGGIAVNHLTQENGLHELGILVRLAAPSFAIFLVLGVLKMHVGIKMQSSSLKKDAVCSLCGAGLALGVLLSAIIVQVMDGGGGDKEGGNKAEQPTQPAQHPARINENEAAVQPMEIVISMNVTTDKDVDVGQSKT